MKQISLIFIGLFISASLMAETQPEVKPQLQFAADIFIHDKTISNKHLEVIVESYSFPAGNQKLKFQKALSLLEEIMNSDEFKRKVISYVRENGRREYSNNFLWKDSQKRFTNEEIYNIIMNGDESRVRINTKGAMNLNSWVKICTQQEYTSSRWCRAVIGSVNPWRSKWIKMNWKYFKKFETHSMVANIVHEWIHLLGFLHAKPGNPDREFLHEEPAYVIGEIAGEIAKKILMSEEIFSINRG